MADVPEGFTVIGEDDGPVLPDGFSFVDETPAAPTTPAMTDVHAVKPGPHLALARQPASDNFYQAPADSYVLEQSTQSQFDADVGHVQAIFGQIQQNQGTMRETTAIAREFNMPESLVAAALPQWQKARAAAGFDAEKLVRENPLLLRLIKTDPNAAKLVMTTKEVPPLMKAWHGFSDFFSDDIVTPEVLAGIDALRASGARVDPNGPHVDKPDIATAYRDAITKRTAEHDAEVAARPQRDAPKQVLERADAKAAVLADGSLTSAAVRGIARYQEGAGELDVSKTYTQLVGTLAQREIARRAGQDTSDLDTKLEDLNSKALDLKQKSAPRAYGDDSGAAQLIDDALKTSASTVDVLKLAGPAAAAGYVAGALVGGVATKTPAGAHVAGAKAAQVAGGLAGFAGSVNLEIGSSYEEFMNRTTDTGEKFTPLEAAGMATFAGIVKGGLEVMELDAMAGAFGPLKALKSGSAEALVTMASKSPKLRSKLVTVLMAFAHGGMAAIEASVKEAIEEMSQTAVDQGVGYVGAGVKDKGLAGAAAAVKAGEPLQQVPAFDGEAIAESGAQALAAGALMGGVSMATHVARAAAVGDESLRGQAKLHTLVALANDEDVQAMPQAMAKVLSDAAVEQGTDKPAVYVDGAEVKRFFQEKGATPEQTAEALTKALGPDGPMRVAESVVTGEKLQVPAAEVLASWGTSEVGQAMLPHSTVSPEHLSAHELANGGQERVMAEAKAIVAAEEARATEAAKVDGLAANIETDLNATGQVSKEQAKSARSLFRHFYETRAAESTQSAEEIANTYRVQYGLAEATPSAAALKQTETRSRAELLYSDKLTGLLNADGFAHHDAEVGGTGPVVAISSPDVKALNDSPKGGHDTTNAMLQVMAEVLHDVPGAARAGTTFFFRGDQALLDKKLAEIHAKLPAGLQALGATGDSVEAARTNLNGHEDSQVAAGRLPERGKTNFALTKLTDDTFKGTKKASDISPSMREKASALTDAEFTNAMYDKEMPGVLSAMGFDAAGEKPFVASLDLRALKDVNKGTGDRVKGDEYLATFAAVAMRAGGENLHFAHLSGDEFAIKGENREELQAFLDDLDAELFTAVIPVKLLLDGKEHVAEFRPRFRHGIGERSYGAADRALNAAKSREPAPAQHHPGDPREAASRRLLGLNDSDGRSSLQGGTHESRRRAAAQVRRDRAADGRDRQAARFAAVGRDALGKLKQDGDALTKGFVEIPEAAAGAARVYRAMLSPEADVSTVVHEAAHSFLDIVQALAEAPGATESSKAMWAMAREALGVEEGTKPTTEQHERMARSFEAWLLEGKAPKKGLEGLFGRLSRWLLSIYKAVTGVPGTDLTPALRATFDRLLATQDEIEAAKTARGPSLDAEALGVTPAEVADLQNELDDALSLGSRRLATKLLEEQQRQTEKWWQHELTQARNEAEAQYENLPARRAQHMLESIGGEPVLLDKAAVKAAIGDRRAPGIRTVVDGVNPDDVADLSGYPTGKHMLEAVLELAPKDSWVAKTADAAMAERFPSVLANRQEVDKLLADGLHSAFEKRILDDIAALQAKATDTKPSPAQAIKRAAELLAGRRVVRDLYPGRALAQERKAAREKLKLALAGQNADALAAARRELLNAYLYRELVHAVSERDAFEETAAQLGKQKSRERLGKASPIYRDAVDSLLHMLGFTDEAPELEPGAKPLQDAVSLMRDDALLGVDESPDWLATLEALEQLDDPRSLTVDQMRDANAALKSLQQAATIRSTVLIEGKRADFEQTRDSLIDEAKTNKRQARALPSSPSAATLVDKIASIPGRASAWLLKPEIMVDWLGGSLLGADVRESKWYKAVFEPLEKARHNEADMHKAMVVPVLEAISRIPASVKKTWSQAIDGQTLFPTHQVKSDQALPAPNRRFQLLVMALNFGNESNSSRLTEGRSITDAQVKAALDILTKEEIDYVNSVHDAFASLFPQLQNLQERLTGVKLKGFDSKVTHLKNGTLTGGYYPVIYDKTVSAAGEKQQASQLAALVDPTFGKFGTAKGHTKARAEGFYEAVSLEPSKLAAAITQQVHDLAFREALMSAGKLVIDPKVQAALKNALGLRRSEVFGDWLKDVGVAPGVEGAAAMSDLFAIAQKIKANTVASALGYSLTNFIEDFSNVPMALAVTDLSAKGLAHGLAAMRAPLEAHAFAEHKSGVMRAAEDQWKRDFFAQVKGVANKTLMQSTAFGAFVERNAFVLMEMSFRMTATPVWLGRYQQSLAAGETEEQAVTAADRTIRKVFPSHHPVTTSSVIRDKNIIGGLLMFHGYFNTIANVALDKVQTIKESPTEMKIKAVGALVAMTSVGGMLSQMLRGKGPDKGEDPAWWTLRASFDFAVGLIPLGNDATHINERLRGSPPTARPTGSFLSGLAAQAEAIAAVSKAITGDGEHDVQKAIEQVTRAQAVFTGTPGTSQAIRTTRYIADVAAGKREMRGFFHVLGGLIYGENDSAPANVFTVIGDALGE